MKTLFLEGIALSYAFAGVLCCAAYVPTIRDLYLHNKASANATTYGLWSFTAFITLLYGVFVLCDALFTAVSAANLFCCGLILFLSVRKTGGATMQAIQ